MKKWMSIFLALCLLLALAACGGAAETQAPAADHGAPAAEQPAPAAQPEGTQGGALHSIALVNATVAGESHMELQEEGTFLARAVLPDRASAVDYWTIDGEKADAGGRRYSLEFESSGADVVSAVLREKLHVSCEGCYLQFLDDNGTAGGPMYQKIFFEDSYVIPTTGQEHAGGSINCHITAKVPSGMRVDYWIVNGTAVRFDAEIRGFQLIGLTKSLEIEAVFTGGIGTSGSDMIMHFDPLPGTPTRLPDDEPVLLDESGTDGWILDDDGSPEPSPTTTGGSGDHVHDWVFDGEHSYPASCTQDGRNAFKCSGCGETYYQTLPVGHQWYWRNAATFSGHEQICSVCGARGATGAHVYHEEYREGGTWQVCSICGYSYQVIN